MGGRALFRLGWATIPTLDKLRIPIELIPAVRLRQLSAVVARETAQTAV